MKAIKLIIVLTVVLAMSSCNSQGITKKDLKTDVDTASYVLGLDIAVKLKGNFSEINQELFIQGVKNGLDSTNVLIDFENIDPILREFFQKKQMADQEKKQAEALKKLEAEFGENKLEGEKFLELNKDNEGVLATESGLQYSVIKEGLGDKPTAMSTVKVHYVGTRIDGTEFDSSIGRGEPAEFKVNRVIKGWTEGLQLMSVGSKYKFYIPQDLAYGAFPGQGGVIKPFDVLVFEVELLEIKGE